PQGRTAAGRRSAWPPGGPRAHPPGSARARRGSPLAPFADLDVRALAGRALDLELVHEALGAGQTRAQPLAGGVALAHGQIDVDDAGALVVEDHLDAGARAVRRLVQRDGAALAVDDDVARELGDGGGDAGLI